VGVVDARRAMVATAADLEVADVPLTINETFRAWLADAHGVVAQGDGLADRARVAALFDELHAATSTGSEPVLAEVATLAALVGAPDGRPAGGRPGGAA